MDRKDLLKVKFCGVEFENPFCLASSPVSNSADMCERAFKAGWGAVVYKTLNVDKSFKIVMPSPRLNSFNYGDKTFVGLQNAEQISDRSLKDNIEDIKYLKKKYPNKVLISSIMGFSDSDWEILAKLSEEAGADMLELNFSCPQMARKDAGHRIGQDYDMVEHFTAVVKKHSKLPVIAKMTPNITDMIPVALAAKRGGADAISAINTVRVISDIDIEKITPMPDINGSSGITGFSGPAVKPIGMRFVSELYNSKELSLPISAIGGIETWRDCLKYTLLGGEVLQISTAVMRYGYRIVEDMAEGLIDYMVDHNIDSIEKLLGLSAKKLIDPEDFDTQIQVISQIDQDRCIGCGQCYIACNDGANQAINFDKELRKASVITERCVGCTLCKHLCPVENCITTKVIDTSVEKHAAIFD